MTITLSETTWDELWQELRQNVRQGDPCDRQDVIIEFPSELADGYKRDIDLPNGISLTLHNYVMHEDLKVTNSQNGESDDDCLEFVFNLSSIYRYWDGDFVVGGQHYLVPSIILGDLYREELAKEPRLAVDIHLAPARLKLLMGMDISSFFPTELKPIVEGEESAFVPRLRKITPNMRLALEQILNCPYQGKLKQIYLESKSLELLVLLVDQFRTESSEITLKTGLHPDDVHRIYQAKQILIEKMDNPPSLITLAHQVGLNDRKLKQGFRQVFKTTVFGYLHHCRMEKAQQLLRQQQSIAIVAASVGYASPTAFNAAFRRKFGIPPKAYQLANRFIR